MTTRVYVQQQGVTSVSTVAGPAIAGTLGALRIKNLGPSTVYLAQTDAGDPPTITEANSYPLCVGESVDVPAVDDWTSWPAWVSTVHEGNVSQIAIIGYNVVA